MAEQPAGTDEMGPGEVGGEQMLTSAPALTATCSGCQRWTPAEAALLAALPDPAEPLEDAAWCELEADHPGPHYGLGQISATTWWWLRWSSDPPRRELVDAGFCGQRPPPHGPGDCTLPAAHVGRHSYELDSTE
ncbi:hypothetical protein [Actinomycetospora soli]|uniref:hypothetical protein n=1 Tax=Actinomycetospora soli TaxID=2893887 RepID=UPI001E47EB52|nr:hypothetical protein [Actinomycetospora soli]MCD2190983.1 hypothetical protein [Actinomycetospora soli]